METFTFPDQPTPSPVSVEYSEILKHPEQYYQGYDLVWIMVAAAMVFLMIPALSFINAGLGNRTFALTLFRLPLVTAAFVGLQWVLWGYALTFTGGTLWWGGELRAAALRDVLARPVVAGDGGGSPGGAQIPELVYMLYEAMFASFTAALICGGTMHRARPARFIVFITLWSFFVYFPIARWSWSSYGWSKQLGTLDFAGGTPVHIVSGTTVAAFAVFCSIEAKRSFAVFLSDAGQRFKAIFDNPGFRAVLHILATLLTFGKYQRSSPSVHQPVVKIGEGTRADGTAPFAAEVRGEGVSHTPTETAASLGGEENTGVKPLDESQPSNVNYVVFGTALLWFGWAGFNGGSALGGNMRAVSAWTSTHIAACAGGVTGMLWIWLLKAATSGPSPPMPSSPESSEGEEEPVPTKNKEDINRLSVFFFCDGAIAGLVAITPGSGYVPPWSAAVFGVVSAFVVLVIFKKLTSVFLRNDPLQIFAVHAGGGLIGMALTAFFVDPVIIGLDGHSTIPHPEYTMGIRLGYQLLDGFMGMGYTFAVTLAILYFKKFVTGIFHRSGADKEKFNLEDEYQATITQYWRSGLDSLGRPLAPISATSAPPSSPRPADPERTVPGVEPERELDLGHGTESTGAPTSSAFTPASSAYLVPSSRIDFSPAGSLAPTAEIPMMPIHESFLAPGRSRDPSMSPGLPPVHRPGT